MNDRLSVPARALGEGLGTGMLATAVVGSGIAAQQLSPDQVGLQLLESSTATALALVALIFTFGPVSGAHLNPAVTLAERLGTRIDTRTAAAYIAAQVVGGCLGAVAANVMFEVQAIDWSGADRATGAHAFAEVVATFGLLTVILGVGASGRDASGRDAAVPVAVAGYIGAAYWFTSSTSFANPAVTVARTLSDTFAGIAPSSAPLFIAAQVAGAVLAVGVARILFPARPSRRLSMPDLGSAHRHSNAPPASGGRADDELPVVLFLCVHNAGRSQMAMGWFNHLAGGRAVARSGGSEPASEVNPAAVAAMKEVGIDITRELPKPWTDEVVRAADVVVTMGCGDTCPYVPGKRYEDWVLDDPAGQGVEVVRPIRDEIGGRVRTLLASLDVPVAT